jgi:hypothetical protein
MRVSAASTPFEAADRLVELLADARIRSRCIDRRLRATGRVGRQRDAAANRELLDEHAPALTRHLRTADDELDRHEDVATGDRSVLERHVEREMAPADRDTGRVARDQCTVMP